MLDRHVVHPLQGYRHVHTAILLHDQNSNGTDFAQGLFRSRGSNNPNRPAGLSGLLDSCRFVFPNGPLLNNADSTRKAWFKSIDDGGDDNRFSTVVHQGEDRRYQPSLERGIDAVLEVIHEEEKCVPRKCIFIGGFGQGFAMAVTTFLADGEGDFAGLVGLNGWMPYMSLIAEGEPKPMELIHRCRANFQPSNFSDLMDANPDTPSPTEEAHTYGIIRRLVDEDYLTPVFMSHPEDDDVVPYEEGERACEVLNRIGLDINFEPYAVGTTIPRHWINQPLGVDDLCHWIRRHFRGTIGSNVDSRSNGHGNGSAAQGVSGH